MIGTGAAGVPGEHIGNAMLGLKNLGFGVGGIRAGEGVDGTVVAKIRTDETVPSLKDRSSRVGVWGGEEVVGGRENNLFYLGSDKRMCRPNEPHDEGGDTGGEGTVHGRQGRWSVPPEATNAARSVLREADSCPPTWMTHRRSPQQASFHTVTSSALLPHRHPSCLLLQQRTAEEAACTPRGSDTWESSDGYVDQRVIHSSPSFVDTVSFTNAEDKAQGWGLKAGVVLATWTSRRN